MVLRNGLVWEIWSIRDGTRRYLGFSWSLRRAQRRLLRAEGREYVEASRSEAALEDLDGAHAFLIGGHQREADIPFTGWAEKRSRRDEDALVE